MATIAPTPPKKRAPTTHGRRSTKLPPAARKAAAKKAAKIKSLPAPQPERDFLGRPTKYDPSACAKVVALGQGGCSRTEIFAELGIGWNTFLRWEAEYPDFRQAIQDAKRFEQAWWEKAGRAAMFKIPMMIGGKQQTLDFNSAGYAFAMENRFPQDYKRQSKVQLTGPGGGPVQVAHSLEPLMAALANMPDDDLRTLEGVVYKVLPAGTAERDPASPEAEGSPAAGGGGKGPV